METVGLLPCAGKGSRLGLSFSKEIFPDLHDDRFRPIIMYTIDAMKNAGINHLIFTINPGKTDLLNFLGNGKQFGMNFSYCIHPTAKSLPESLNEAYHLIKDKQVIFAMPDTVISPFNFISDMLEAHNNNLKAAVTLGCFKTNNPTSVSVVDFEDNLIKNVIEKPKETHLDWMWGTMVWEPEFSHLLNDFIKNSKPREGVSELYLSDALHPYIKEEKVYSHIFINGTYTDLGTKLSIKENFGMNRKKTYQELQNEVMI
jgi:glucose-1-phosphate thymidylyltransferase